MANERLRKRRWWIGVAAGLVFLYVGAVVLRVLYPCEGLARVSAQAEVAGLDPALVCSVIRAESRFRAGAVSPRGAVGLMQLMPDTADWVADRLGLASRDLTDPETNLRLGTSYLRYLVDRFGRIDLALAAYNAGPTRVDQWIAAGEAEYAETTAFVRRVLRGVPVYRFLLSAPILVQITPSLPL
jgi:soluble lytic murein transglycosylase